MEISGYIVSVLEGRILKGTIRIENGRIIEIKEHSEVPPIFILPGFIDAHIHIESSLLPPSEFARFSSIHGTVGCVCDPHEIANVLGKPGIDFMIENGKKTKFSFYFGAPPCVPATPLEISGAQIGPLEIEYLLMNKEVKFLSEVMDIQGVLNRRSDLMEKIETAKRLKKPIDGHAPSLRGETLRRYVEVGISTDHETVNIEEGEEKIQRSMHLILRQGSLSKDFERLLPLCRKYPKNCMFGSDDKAPHELIWGHIDEMVRKAVASGIDLFHVLSCASVNPVLHYGLDIGLMKVGDRADFILVDNLKDFNVIRTYIDGEPVALEGKTLIPRISCERINSFHAKRISVDDLKVRAKGKSIRIIQILEGSLFTRTVSEEPKVVNGEVVSDVDRDILKLVILNRYTPEKPKIGFVRGFGLKRGAFASSILHDSHHIVALGTSDREIVEAVNFVVDSLGGLSFVSDDEKVLLPLPVAGLMSDEDGFSVAIAYENINKLVQSCGSPLHFPFMALSFIGLPVIPEIKLTTKGLFDVQMGQFVELFSA